MGFLGNVLSFQVDPVLIAIIAVVAVAILTVIIVATAIANKKKKAAILAEYRAKEQANAEKQAQIEKEKAERRAAAQKRLQEEAAARAATEKKTKKAVKAAEEETAKADAEEEAKKAAKAKKDAAKAKKEAEAKAAQEAAEKEATAKAAEEQAAAEAVAETPKKVSKPAAKKTVKEQTAEETKPVETAEKPATKGSRYSGKWVVYKVMTEGMENEEEMFFFELHASNGEKLLSSEEYTSQQGALRGIETHKANIEKGNFRIVLSKKGDYIFKLLNGKNTLLCTGANYPTKMRCESAVESVKRFAATAVIDENVQEILIKPEDEEDYTEPVEQVNESYVGKWIISANQAPDGGETAYYFELFANNGEKLLSSEEYSSYIGAINGIQTHKTNIEKGNFRISLTKRGDYIFKLLSGNGQLLCLGEHYKSKARCESAVESVKRFAQNAPVVTEEGVQEQA